MSAVDAPPGVAFAGVAAGEFVARKRARRLARIGFWYVLLSSGATLALARRAWYTDGIEVLMAAPLMFVCVAILGYAVRSARLRVDVDGFRWGWHGAGFRMSPHRVKRLALYRDAMAVTPRRGSTWYLSARDWRGFDDLSRALERAGLTYERIDRRAPLGARMQSYGLVLDLLLIGNAIASTLALGLAFSL